LINLAVQVITVRYLAKVDFGAFAFGISMVALATNLATLGLPKSLSRFMPIYQEGGEDDKVAGLLFLVCGTVIGLGIAAVALVYGLASLSGTQTAIDSTSLSLLLILIVLVPIDSLDRILEAVFAVSGQVRSIFLRRHVIGPGLKLVAVLAVVFSGGSVGQLAVCYVFAGILGLAFYLSMLRSILRQINSIQSARQRWRIPAREIFSYTLPLFSSQVGFVMRSSLVVLLLQYFSDSIAVAEFRSVLPFARLNEVVLASFAVMFTPVASRMFARRETEEINELYWRSSIWIMLFSLPIFLITGVLADSFTPWVIGPRYASSSSVLMILAIGFFFDAILGFNVHTLRVFAKVWNIVAADVVAIVVCFGMSLLLIPKHAAWGAATAICTATLIRSLLLQLMLRTVTGVGVMQWRYARLYLSAVASIAVLAGIQYLWNVPFLLGAGIAATLYVALVLGHRSILRVDETFPELCKIPLVARVFGNPDQGKLPRLSKGGPR
jgi:O-antigen/teichoic acid export membrane protein